MNTTIYLKLNRTVPIVFENCYPVFSNQGERGIRIFNIKYRSSVMNIGDAEKYYTWDFIHKLEFNPE